MPGPMPYHLERGPWFYAIDDMLNVDANLKKVITDLATPGGLPKVLAKYVKWIDEHDPRTNKEREQHFKRHWMGYGPKPADTPMTFTEWLKTAGFKPASDSLEDVEYAVGKLLSSPNPPAAWPTTGWWTDYDGDVGEIVRITLHQAAQVSRGKVLTKPSDIDSSPRKLPIMSLWTCGQMWMEGWIVSRLFDDDRGVVTVHLNTPGMGEMPKMNPSSVPGAQSSPGNPPSKAVADPVPVSKQKGLGKDVVWVVTHHDHIELPPLKPGDGPTIAGIGPIGVVEPAYKYGGPRP